MKVVIMGPAGKMGKAMVKCAYKNSDVELIGAVGPKGRDYINKDIGLVCSLGEQINIKIYDDLEKIINNCDVVLDCTTPDTTMQTLEICKKSKKAFVTGTTGFSDNEKNTLRKAGESIPIILAYNTSKLFNIMFSIIREVASKIGLQADIDLIDIHDNKKLDAPSGTSKEIAEIISKELNYRKDDFTYGKKGMGLRKEKGIAFNSIRSGGYPGSVKTVFGLEDERMELSAYVYNMNTYANGMIEAGLFLKGKTPGFYDLKEVFDL
jgi:4-hydroxy-tetrahydrodipicolinate reductase